MKEIFVPYEIAKKLKEIGFNAPCLCFYDIDEALIFEVPPQSDIYLYLNQEIRLFDYNSVYNELEEWQEEIETYYSAPSWEQVFKWFRERGYFSDISYLVKYKKYYYDIIFERKEEFDKHNPHPILDFNNSLSMVGEYDTYEECRDNLILKLIEIYKEWKK